MPNYRGRRPGTRRVVISVRGKPQEWIVEGSKRDGDAFEARKRIELQTQSAPASRVVPTISEFCERQYTLHAEQHLKDSTWRKVRKYQLSTLKAAFGELRLSEMSLAVVEAFKLARLHEVTPNSVNHELRILGAILTYARELGYPVPLFKWKKLPVRGRRRVRAWTIEELDRLWAACRSKEPELLPLLLFLVNTGCRKGEAMAARWEWLDEPAGLIRIPSTEVWQPKNGKGRDVPLSSAVRAALSCQPRETVWIFPSRLGTRFVDFPEKRWRRVTVAAGLTGGPHQLRHTFASHFLEATKDLFLLSKVLGHSHAKVTEVYAHLLPGHLDRAMDAVNIGPKTMAVVVAKAT